MDANEFRRRGKEMVDYVADYLDTIARRRVLPDVQPGYLREMLPNKAPKKGEPWDDVMKDVERAIMPGVTHWQHPRFHAYFPAGNSFPSILGGMLSDAIGCVGFSWAASPACTELETIVLDWLAKMIGLPPVFWHEHGIGGGVIQGSASDCVLVSLLAARYEALKELKAKSPDQEDGVLLTKLVAYCSKLAHSCVVKAGMICLVKIRELDIDENNSLRGQTLEKAIEEDRKLGLVPFYVAATLGTTAVCSFDNLAELGLVCERNDIWLHVDAAYAGSALICPEFRHLQRGVEHANSFNMNPNKWMLMNFDCSCLWVRDRRLLTTALTVDPVYLQHCNSDKAIDFRHWGIPLSRRFRSLKLWFVIRSYGIEGLQKYIREHCRLAKKFESLVRKDNRFIVIGKVTLGLVCFRLQGHNYRTQTLLRAINVSGKLHMVPALINEDYVIRFAVCAENATDDDITFAWDVISEISAGVIAACDAQEEQELAQQLEIMTSLSEEEETIGGEEVKVLVGSPKLNGNGVAGGIPMSTSLRGFSINSDKAAASATGAGASAVAEDVEAGEGGSGTEAGEEDEVFLYDNNIPSLPTLPSAYEQVKRNGPKPYHRRNVLVRMVSDPRCYSPRIVRSFRPHDDSRRSSDARPPSESSRPPSDGMSGYSSQAQQPQPQEGMCK